MNTNKESNVSSSKSFSNGLKKNNADAFKLNYSPFLGGMNTTNAALAQYDPLKTGRARLFLVHRPTFMDRYLEQTNNEELTRIIQHMFEYGFTKVDGLGSLDLETDSITGGYTGRQFEVGTLAKDGTSGFSVGMYEWSGSPMHEYLKLWMTGISDPITGYGTYHGAREYLNGPFLKYRQDNHTAEFIYCVTDPTGRSDALEYACMFSNCMPKSVSDDHFNYASGESNLAEMTIEMTANKYESPDINALAARLVAKHNILKDSMNFKSGYRFGGGGVYDLSTRVDTITEGDPNTRKTAADANWENVRGSNIVGAEDNSAWDWTNS